MFIQSIAISALLAALPVVIAQSAAWGQCGGTGYSGSTTCVTGYVCTYSNAYYSQCVPGTAATTVTSKSSTVGTTTATSTVPSSTGSPNYWFSFGDSYTQTGFDITSTQPSVGNVFGNPPYPGWTATGGEHWLDVAVTKYNKSLILAYNFAYGGATIDAKLVTPYQPTVKSLIDQVNEFLTWNAGIGKGKWRSANSLFSIYIGINDIGNSYYMSGDRSAFSGVLINAEFKLVQQLYDAGARNFLFLNVPPVQRSPTMVAQGSAATTLEESVIKTHNAKLAAAASGFKANHTGVTTYLFDNYAAFNTVLDNPSAYGIGSVTSYGGTTDFWGNDYHPSSLAQVVFGKQVAALLSSTIW